jgi:molecular chaperone GrpE
MAAEKKKPHDDEPEKRPEVASGDLAEAEAGPEADAPETDSPEPDALGDAGEVEELSVEDLSEEDAALLDQAASDLVADMRSDMLRAQAELVNFRNRVERDRAANREAVIAEVIRSLLPAVDDLSRAEKHGDLEGSPLELVAVKLKASLERYGLREVGAVGEPFDPHLHEAVVHFASPDVKVETVAEVIDPGYALGDRLIRAAKVAVSVPE